MQLTIKWTSKTEGLIFNPTNSLNIRWSEKFLTHNIPYNFNFNFSLVSSSNVRWISCVKVIPVGWGDSVKLCKGNFVMKRLTEWIKGKMWTLNMIWQWNEMNRINNTKVILLLEKRIFLLDNRIENELRMKWNQYNNSIVQCAIHSIVLMFYYLINR